MRQQYHSRNTPQGCDIWDVNKLVEQAKAMPVIEVDLSNIKELHEEYWFGAEGSKPPTCWNIAEHFKLMQDADLKYPVILCEDGRVIDGMHRICKALAQGHKTIRAVKLDKNPAPDYQNMSLKDLPYDDDGEIL